VSDSRHNTSPGESSDEPNLLDQTLALAGILKKVSDRDPKGHPSEAAVRVFREWLEAAKKSTEEPRYFEDVAANFEVESQSNRDLFDMFELLHPYVAIIDDRRFPDDDPAATGRTYISLPTL
jgi:hypothetical protein